jgi:hypothetical protein
MAKHPVVCGASAGASPVGAAIFDGNTASKARRIHLHKNQAPGAFRSPGQQREGVGMRHFDGRVASRRA